MSDPFVKSIAFEHDDEYYDIQLHYDDSLRYRLLDGTHVEAENTDVYEFLREIASLTAPVANLLVALDEQWIPWQALEAGSTFGSQDVALLIDYPQVADQSFGRRNLLP